MGFFKKLIFKKLVATDKFGNRYYQQGKNRWIVYKGLSEPSKIPAQYYLWLHHSVDCIERNEDQYHWQRDRVPNLTGTNGAYLPAGHMLKNPFSEEHKNYKAWEPGHE